MTVPRFVCPAHKDVRRVPAFRDSIDGNGAAVSQGQRCNDLRVIPVLYEVRAFAVRALGRVDPEGLRAVTKILDQAIQL